jgi:site-specific DNA-methyltransferase (adenine-specific)
MSRYPDNYFELAIVDIPYGLGDKLTQGGTWANKYKKADAKWDILPKKEYFLELNRVSINQIIWGGNYAHEYLKNNRHFIIWDKLSHMPTMADCEYAWSSFDTNAKIYKHPRNTNEKRIHITQKPIKLYKWLLTNYAKENDKILDTHLGSGSIAIACHELGFDLTACELDLEYYEAAHKRFKEQTAQLRLKL